MKITDSIEAHLEICDIETMACFTDIGCYNPDTKTWIEFEISEWKNDLYKFVKWYTSKPCDYLVTFNGIGFDQQVLQHIVNHYDEWYDLKGEEVAAKIYEFSTSVIENGRYNIRPPYQEYHFPVKPMDLFKINHFDNDAKMTSLKWCAFMMNMDVEEMPIHHGVKKMTRAEADTVIMYRRNDCMVTYGLLYLTLGQVDEIPNINGGFPVPELDDYKGANKIEQRINIQAVTGLQCMNWSDVKIGEEKNKLTYMKSEGIKDPYSLQPTKVRQAYGQKFKNFFPKTMEFQTQELKDFIKSLGEEYVKSIKQEFPITIGQTTYTIAKGGIHSTEKNRVVRPMNGWFLTDADVGSQYPNSILKLEVFPPHLKRTIIEQFQENVNMKDEYKQMGKNTTDKAEKKKLKSLEGLTKLSMNGGYYGKMGQPGSFLEYPEGVLKVCMGNQIEILMLIEMLELAGFKVVSGNTDGIVTMYPEEKKEEYLAICHEWEKKVGNDKLGKLEYANFTALWQENINHYLGQKIDDTTGELSTKKKGRFVTTYGSPGCEINKNKSKRIIPLALEAYFIDGKDPAEFIRNHENIMDFCVAKKATGQLHYEELLPTGTAKVHKKLVRYYVSKDGNVFKKRGISAGEKGGPMDNYCEAPPALYPWLGEPLMTYFNKGFKKDNIKDYNIDYDFYILEALKRIDKIEGTKKSKQFAEKFKPTQQGSLF
jgi:hypothetical protein